MRKYMRWILTVSTSAFLSGCGNFIESVDIGTWAEAGEDHPPHFRPRNDVAISISTPGSGPSIRAGDLVQLRLQTNGTDFERQSTKAFPTQTLWLWTGDVEEGQYQWGGLGDKYLRAKLIGMRIGTRFNISPTYKYSASDAVSVPRNGFYVDYRNSLHGEFGEHVVSKSSGSDLYIESDAEILNACKGRLYRRTTSIRQWGILLGPEMPSESREGEVYWSALRGECTTTAKEVWLLTGPNTGSGRVGGRLYNGYDTFKRKHPKWMYPEDYWRPTEEPFPSVPQVVRLLRNLCCRGGGLPSARSASEDKLARAVSAMDEGIPSARSASEDKLAGAAWAMDEGISREEDCRRGSKDFIAGCKRVAGRR